MQLSLPVRHKLNREMVAEQCPAHLAALTASTHLQQYKNRARFTDRHSTGFFGKFVRMRSATFDS